MKRKVRGEATESVRVSSAVMKAYREWAAVTDRSLTGLLNISLLFALRKQSEIEREVAMKLEPKQ